MVEREAIPQLALVAVDQVAAEPQFVPAGLKAANVNLEAPVLVDRRNPARRIVVDVVLHEVVIGDDRVRGRRRLDAAGDDVLAVARGELDFAEPAVGLHVDVLGVALEQRVR